MRSRSHPTTRFAVWQWLAKKRQFHCRGHGRSLTAHWLQVAVLTAAFALAYAVAVWLNASYVARATLRTPDLTLAEFKRVISGDDPAVISEIANRIFQGDDARAAAAREVTRDPSFVDHFIPIYTISRSDLRKPPLLRRQPPPRRLSPFRLALNPPTAPSPAGWQSFLPMRLPMVLKSALVEYVTAQRGVLATTRERLQGQIAGDRASLARVETKIENCEAKRSHTRRRGRRRFTTSGLHCRWRSALPFSGYS
jgi:hypothetical protein